MSSSQGPAPALPRQPLRRDLLSFSPPVPRSHRRNGGIRHGRRHRSLGTTPREQDSRRPGAHSPPPSWLATGHRREVSRDWLAALRRPTMVHDFISLIFTVVPLLRIIKSIGPWISNVTVDWIWMGLDVRQGIMDWTRTRERLSGYLLDTYVLDLDSDPVQVVRGSRN
jgi:hypothetical protein